MLHSNLIIAGNRLKHQVYNHYVRNTFEVYELPSKKAKSNEQFGEQRIDGLTQSNRLSI